MPLPTRQDDAELGELAVFRVDVNRAAVLLDNDVMADGETKPSSLTGRLSREERIEYLFQHAGRNAGAVVTNPDLYAVTEVLRRCRKGRLVAHATILLLALGRGIEAVRDEVQ